LGGREIVRDRVIGRLKEGGLYDVGDYLDQAGRNLKQTRRRVRLSTINHDQSVYVPEDISSHLHRPKKR
jgi:hypothetical protein